LTCGFAATHDKEGPLPCAQKNTQQRGVFVMRFEFAAQQSFFPYICPPNSQIQLPLKTNFPHFEIVF
jgi:hypothetical protein